MASPKSATPKGVLNDRQLRFAAEYLVDLNATQAAIRAGYSAKTAKQVGSRLLTHVDVSAAIDAERKRLTHASGVTREKIIAEMAKVAFSDLRDLFNDDGSLKAVKDWPDGAAGTVSAVESEELFQGFGEDRQHVGYTKKLKLWDKGKQLENLLKHLGMAEDKPPEPVAVVVTVESVLAELRAATAR